MNNIKYFTKEIKDIDEKQGIVQVYANAFDNLDSDGDISLKGSFTKTLKENLERIKWYFNHGRNNDYFLLGVPFIDGGIQNNFGLLATNKFNFEKKSTIPHDVFEDYKLYKELNRAIEHSIGVEAVKYKYLQGKEVPQEYRESGFEKVRTVSEWKLWEMSTLSTWGANDRTGELVSIKDLTNIEDTVGFLNIMLRKGNYSDERFIKIENTLNTLKALIREPQESTHNEPDDSTQLEPLLQVFNKYKLFEYGKND